LDSRWRMPGESPEARALVHSPPASVVAHGHTPSTALSVPTLRAWDVLDSLRGLFAPKRQLVDRVIAASRAGHCTAGNWLELAPIQHLFLGGIEQAFAA